MTRFWIRVNARLTDDAEVQAFAIALLPRLPEWIAVRTAAGLLVSLWGRVVDEQEDGNLSARRDNALEEWAGWRGKAGLFAREFRARFTTNGQINEWADYQGKLIERREKDRRRKAAGSSAGNPQEPPPDIGRNPAGGSAELPTPNGNGNDQALVSAPYSAERQELAPDAPAPEGARDGATDETHRAREIAARNGLRPGEHRASRSNLQPLRELAALAIPPHD